MQQSPGKNPSEVALIKTTTYGLVPDGFGSNLGADMSQLGDL